MTPAAAHAFTLLQPAIKSHLCSGIQSSQLKAATLKNTNETQVRLHQSLASDYCASRNKPCLDVPGHYCILLYIINPGPLMLRDFNYCQVLPSVTLVSSEGSPIQLYFISCSSCFLALFNHFGLTSYPHIQSQSVLYLAHPTNTL